jgi:glycosyltransferase involved in cell wall biosynthesis
MPHLYGSWMSSGVPAAGYTAWETDRVPHSWTVQLNRLGRVLVPCRWNRETLLASGVTTPVDVVPHILPGDVARLDPPAPAGPFTFYCIAPWSVRKGVDLLVRAYWQAFPNGEPVRLVLKTSERDLTRHSRTFALWRLARLWHTSRRALARLRSRHGRPAPVELIAGDRSRSEILDVHRAGHCFVSLTRGEGWGLGAFEAAGVGNPVVITGLGGHLDFLDPDLAYLVDYELAPCRVGHWESSFDAGQRWAEPSLEHAAWQMRQVYERFAEARERAMALRQRVRARFSPDAVLPALRAALAASGSG